MKMAEDLPPVWRTAADPFQVVVRYASSCVCADEEISRNRIEQQSCCPAPDVQSDPGDRRQQSGCATLGQVQPTLGGQSFSVCHCGSQCFVRKSRPRKNP